MERSRKSLVLFLLAVFGLILTPWAKEYWQEKPFNRWNEQEAMAMLTHSPWSQSSTIPENYAGSSPPGSLHLEEGAQMGSAPNSADRGMSSGIGGGNSIPVHVRWCSSQRVRQAMFRLKQLHGNLTEAQEFLKQDMPDYAICISCQIIQPFNTVTLDTIKPKTFLLSKKDKSKKIGLKSYSPPRERQDTQAIFVFPRTLDGKATIELADEEITFVTELGKNKFRGTFKLAKMVVDGQLDLY